MRAPGRRRRPPSPLGSARSRSEPGPLRAARSGDRPAATAAARGAPPPRRPAPRPPRARSGPRPEPRLAGRLARRRWSLPQGPASAGKGSRAPATAPEPQGWGRAARSVLEVNRAAPAFPGRRRPGRPSRDRAMTPGLRRVSPARPRPPRWRTRSTPRGLRDRAGPGTRRPAPSTEGAAPSRCRSHPGRRSDPGSAPGSPAIDPRRPDAAAPVWRECPRAAPSRG